MLSNLSYPSSDAFQTLLPVAGELFAVVFYTFDAEIYLLFIAGQVPYR